MTQEIFINSQFDGGNIESVRVTDDNDIRLKIRKDNAASFLQWFYFSASGLAGKTCHFAIENASETSYPKGWDHYDIVYSTDRKIWKRTPAEFDGQALRWTVSSRTDQLWFAYFAPYTLEQHADLVSRVAASKGVRHEVLGLTHQGRPIDYLQLRSLDRVSAEDGETSDSNRPQLWVIARQHPGESMAEWFVEGLLDRLLDADDACSRALRSMATIHVVPNMNPDGTFLGNLRTNSLGINLNREWAHPDPDRSPEVHHVYRQMRHTGVTLALDVHGDEVLPYNFIAGTEGIPGWTDERNEELLNVKHTWASINPDFQDRYGYPVTPVGKANLTMCSNQLASTFNCLAMTLEMPFKDTANVPRPGTGWSPERSRRLGASYVDVAYLTLCKRLIRKSF